MRKPKNKATLEFVPPSFFGPPMALEAHKSTPPPIKPYFEMIFQIIFFWKMSKLQTKVGNQITLSHSHSLSFSHYFTLVILNNFWFHINAQKSHSQCLSHYLTLTLSLLFTQSHSFTLVHSISVILNNLLRSLLPHCESESP